MNADNYRIRQPVPARNFLCVLLLGHTCMAAGATLGQLDNFSDGTIQSWAMGASGVTETHMTNVATGGPAGSGDRYLEVVADNTSAAGGRLTLFNQSQWTGDYLTAGITTISMDLKNFSSTETLNLRLAINGGPSVITGGLFATGASISLASGSDWTHATFSLAPGDLVPVSGLSGVTGNDVLATLGNVSELRILNSATPDWNGSPVGATLGLDNIQAVPIPPSLGLLGSGVIGLFSWRRRSAHGRTGSA